MTSLISHSKSTGTVETVVDTAVVEVLPASKRKCSLHPDASLLCSVEAAAGGRQRALQLKGKKIVFICCGLDGLDSKRFCFVRASSLDVRAFVIEDNDNVLAAALEEENVVEEFVRVSMRPRATLLKDVVTAIAALQERVGRIDGVCTFWDDAVGLCARVCEHFGLPGNPLQSVDIAHDKHLTREAMRKAGIPTPNSMLIRSVEDVSQASAAVKFPAILKPMYGASSLAVLKVEHEEDVLSTYQRVLEMLEEAYNEGELMGLTFDDDGSNESGGSRAFSESPLSNIVMEEFLDGEEVDVDIILNDGVVAYSCVVDDWPLLQPWFTEVGNNCPSILSKADQAALVEMAASTATKAMNFRNGVLHIELKNTSRGPRIIEVNPRMGGGPIWRLHKLAYGVDLIEEQLYAAVGLPPVPDVPKRPLHCASCGEKFFQRSMTVPKEFCEVVRTMKWLPNVIEASVLVEPGEKIVGIEDGFPTRAARFIVLATCPKEAEEYANKLLDMCDIPEVIRRQEKGFIKEVLTSQAVERAACDSIEDVRK